VSRAQRLTVLALKAAGYLVAFGGAFVTVFAFFFRERPDSFRLEVAGVFLLSFLAFAALGAIRKYRRNKEVAHEVARNLGQPDQAFNPIVFEVLNYVAYVLPFIVLILINNVLRDYGGNAIWPLLLVVLSFTIGYGTKIAGVAVEQSFLRQAQIERLGKEQDQLVEKLKSSLTETQNQ
jgi:Na+/H+-dicarboxylate symporter